MGSDDCPLTPTPVSKPAIAHTTALPAFTDIHVSLLFCLPLTVLAGNRQVCCYLQSPIRRPFMCVTVLTPAVVEVLVVSKASNVYVLRVTEDLAPQTELIEMLLPSIFNSLSVQCLRAIDFSVLSRKVAAELLATSTIAGE